MKSSILFLGFASLLALTILPAQADDFETADKNLNTTWSFLISELPDSTIQALRDAQRNWIRYRDAHCAALAPDNEYSHKKCMTEETQKREKQLADIGNIPLTDDSTVNKIEDILSNIDKLDETVDDSDLTCVTSFMFDDCTPISTYAHLGTIMSYRFLGQASQKDIFLSGPHRNDGLNLTNARSYGRYNPEFLDWFEIRLKRVLANKMLVESTRKQVHKRLGEAVHLFIMARNYLKNNPELEEKLKENYPSLDAGSSFYRNYFDSPNINAIARPIKAESQLDWVLMEIGKQNSNRASFAVTTAFFFWVRRTTDGTDAQFERMLMNFLDKYQDADRMKLISQIQYKAPSNLPLLPSE